MSGERKIREDAPSDLNVDANPATHLPPLVGEVRSDDAAAPSAARAGGARRSTADHEAELTRAINDEHNACRRAGASMVRHAIRCGEMLIEAKGMVGHGGWLDWLAEHFDGSEDTAQLYMRLARHRAELLEPKTGHVRFSTLRAALAAVAPSRKPDVASSDEPDGGRDGDQNEAEEITAGKANGTLPEPRRGAEREAELTQTADPAAPVREPEVALPEGHDEGRDETPEPAPSQSALGRGAQPTFYSRSDLPVAANVLAEALGSGEAVALACDIPAAEAVRQKALKEVKVFMEAAVRAAGAERRDAHLLVLCSTDAGFWEAAERALQRLGSKAKKTLDPAAEDRERRRYQQQVLREAKEAGTSLYQAVMEAGGIKMRDDLREEERAIPLAYRKSDGLPGDEMSDHLRRHHPELGITTERELIDALSRRQ
jgi:hypothetical protein